ncbi:MAG: P-II family nitrogen regulator [Candidatus Hydrothermarchaeaceae archaeon]
MKKIEAIIRPEKLNPVKSTLEDLGFPGMTVSDVKGRGRQKGITQQWRGKEYKVDLLPKIKLDIVVSDEDMDKVINAILEAAPMQKIGDGKIFVSTIEEIIRVRTGERGKDAV